MQQLLTQCTRLRSLTITNSTLVKTLGLKAMRVPGQLDSYQSPLSLQTLRLKSCAGVNNVTLAHIARTCPDLRELDLTGCRKVVDEGLCRLVGLADVEPQNTDASASSSTMVAELVGCTRLEKLVLRGCYLLTQSGLLRAISVLDLTSLDVGSITNLGDLTLKLLAPFLPRLSSLSLAGCVNVTDGGLAKLRTLTSLTSLDLRGLPAITDHGLPHLMTLSRLSRLSLKFCPRLEGRGFMSWTMGLPLPLEVLELQGLAYLTDSAIETLSTSPCVHKLIELDLRACSLVSNRGIQHIATAATNLRTLRLEAQEEIDDDGLALIQRYLGHVLTTLDLERMPSLTDVGVAQLELPAVEILSLQGCAQLSYSSVLTIKDRCPRLQLLNLKRCSTITLVEANELARHVGTVLQ